MSHVSPHPAGTALGQDTARVVLGAPQQRVRRVHGASLQAPVLRGGGGGRRLSDQGDRPRTGCRMNL